MHILAAETVIAGPCVRVRVVSVDSRGVSDVSFVQTYVRPKVMIWTKGVPGARSVRLPRGERITTAWAKAYTVAMAPLGEALDVEL